MGKVVSAMGVLAGFVRLVDRLNDRLGHAIAWLTLFMVVEAFAVVVLRYVFSIGFVWMQEIYVWMHGFLFMLGAGYTLLHGGHVRVDLLYKTKSRRYRDWVDLLGSLFLLMPFVVTIAWVSWPYVAAAVMRLEGSREAGGLPGLFVLKSMLLFFSLGLGLQGLAEAGRALIRITGHRCERLGVSDLEDGMEG
jgi:TRAP-type mannitol/chloroaromatic compound transport system permease small subunit